MTGELAPLASDDAAFVEGSVSIIAAARDSGNGTTVSRAIGCRVSADRLSVTIFLSASQSNELLADIRDNGAIAVVFSRPTSHRTIQLKGTDATIVPSVESDASLRARYARGLVEEIGRIGFSEALVRTVLDVAQDDVVAVEFTPTAAYLQTPGPKAGTPLGTKP